MGSAWVWQGLAATAAIALGAGVWASPELWGTSRRLPRQTVDWAVGWLGVLAALRVPGDVGGAAALWASGVAAAADLWERVLPRRWSALVAVAGLWRLAAAHAPLWPPVLAALGVAALFAVLAAATRGGLGGGDVWFAGAAALAGGWPWGVWGVWAGCAAAGLAGLARRCVRRNGGPVAVPLGPWIALGLAAAVFWGAPSALS